jgi:hypothetical protein
MTDHKSSTERTDYKSKSNPTQTPISTVPHGPNALTALKALKLTETTATKPAYDPDAEVKIVWNLVKFFLENFKEKPVGDVAELAKALVRIITPYTRNRPLSGGPELFKYLITKALAKAQAEGFDEASKKELQTLDAYFVLVKDIPKPNEHEPCINPKNVACFCSFGPRQKACADFGCQFCAKMPK